MIASVDVRYQRINTLSGTSIQPSRCLIWSGRIGAGETQRELIHPEMARTSLVADFNGYDFAIGDSDTDTAVDTTGIVTFDSAPGDGLAITADFSFDVPVRFDIDQMMMALEEFQLHTWGQIPIIEVRV